MWRLAGLVACTHDPGEPPGDDPCAVSGAICTWMGKPGLAMLSGEGVSLSQAALYFPEDIVFAPDGSAYVPDFNNHRVREISPDGLVTTVAGTGVPGDGPRDGGDGCEEGCPAFSTDLWHPSQVALDPTRPDVLLVVAWHNHRLVEVDLVRETVTWVGGIGESGYGKTLLSYPSSAAYTQDGTLFVSDQGNQLVRQWTGEEFIDFAGVARKPGYGGDGGPAADALLHGHEDWIGGPTSKIEISGRTLWLADTLNGVIRAIDLDTGTIETAIGRFVPGAEIGSLPSYSGDGGPAKKATFSVPRDITLGPDGALYVADSGNHCVRRVDPDGIVDVFAGTCGEAGVEGDEGPALEAHLDFPSGVSFDAAGNLYIADANNHVIRRVAR